MIASDYRHSILITLRSTTGQGDRGHDEYATKTIGSVMARIEPLSGRKLDLARQQIATCTHEVTIRYLQGVTPECKVIFNGRVFNIGNVNNRLENSFEQTLLCTEVVNG